MSMVYQGFISPTYDFTVYVAANSRTPLNLTGVDTATCQLLFLPLFGGLTLDNAIAGAGTFTIPSATLGQVSYQWSPTDMQQLNASQSYQLFFMVHIPGDAGPRLINVGSLLIAQFPGGGLITFMTTQETDIQQVGGSNVATTYGGMSIPAGTLPVVLIVPPSANAQPISAALGSLVDGSIATLGTEADAAWSGTGNATVIAALKKLVAELAATLAISGAVTANAGTNLNTSLLALETGGNLAGIKADADSLVTNTGNTSTALGTQADAAWSGTGSGSEIAILKKLVAALEATLTVSGGVTANAGTNLNTSLLALESGGNLATSATKLTSILTALQGVLAVNVTQEDGHALAPGNDAIPVLNSAAAGAVAPYSSNVAALTANTDAPFTFGATGNTQVNHVIIQNNWTGNVSWELDAVTTAGSMILTPGQSIVLDVQVTAVHLQAAGTPNINGNTANNIVLRAWL